MAVYKILIVDDFPEHILVITSFLLEDDYQYEIFTASNGQEACKKAVSALPHLIIMDWDMPVMNGLEAIIYLKKNSKTKNIPIIVASGFHTDSEALKEALSNGAIDFVSKPLNKVELIARVHATLYFVDSYNDLIRQKEINFKQQIIYKQTELTNQALFIAHQNEFLSLINKQLKELLNTSNAKSKKIIFDLIEGTNKRIEEFAWEQFEDHFGNAYNDFFEKLNKHFPGLSANERKLCALLRMNMSSKEIAQLTFQEPSSIDVARYRLRKKLGLGKNDNLVKFIVNL